jgi:hypothetical protein
MVDEEVDKFLLVMLNLRNFLLQAVTEEPRGGSYSLHSFLIDSDLVQLVLNSSQLKGTEGKGTEGVDGGNPVSSVSLGTWF